MPHDRRIPLGAQYHFRLGDHHHPGGPGHVAKVGGMVREAAGAPQTIQVKDGIPNATAYLLFGTGQANVPVGGGCSLLVSPVFPLLLPLPLSASGSAYLLATIPPFLSGVTLTMQALIPDPNGSGKFASSRGLEMEIP